MRVGALGASLWILAQTLGCAKDVVLQRGFYVDRRLQLAVEDPARFGAGWERASVEGALLAFRAPGGASMTMLRQCQRPPAPLPVLARQLLLGTEEPVVSAQGPQAVDGDTVYVVVARAGLEGRAADVKTVTRQAGPCTLDWVLVAPEGLAPVEADFDRWWQSLRAAAAAQAAGGSP